MNRKLFYPLLLLLVVTLSSGECKKLFTNLDADGLPPATQTGANTLGFLLNGQPWTPKGFAGLSGNLSLYYDVSFRGGVFNIAARRTLSDTDKQGFVIASDSIQNEGGFILGQKNSIADFWNSNCSYYGSDVSVTIEGICTITKLDKVNKIFSGTFELTLSKQGCNTIRITKGRFDMRWY
jgi:hypothetical protein